MNRRLIIDDNAVYELDEKCMLGKRLREEEPQEKESGKEVEQDVYMEEYKKTFRRTEI